MLRFANSSICKLTIVMILLLGNAYAEEGAVRGKASYLERIALPQNAVFEASLEDVSLMDVPSVTVGSTIISPSGQIPISFNIKYDTNIINLDHLKLHKNR